MNTIQVTVRIESTLASSSTQSEVNYLSFVWLLVSFTAVFSFFFFWLGLNSNRHDQNVTCSKARLEFWQFLKGFITNLTEAETISGMFILPTRYRFSSATNFYAPN